jgi:radical SAM superfamily enzyme YgiQ (UPF0313 family)
LRGHLPVRLIDLGVLDDLERAAVLLEERRAPLCGLSVSAQTLDAAVEWTRALRQRWPGARVVWGGELPSLVPALCLEHADSVVRGRFEPLAEDFLADLRAGRMHRSYGPKPWNPGQDRLPPALDLVEHPSRYPSFVGTPLETSVGCTHRCSFCLVHVMQRSCVSHDLRSVAADLRANPRRFAQVVDYNLGADRAHLLRVCDLIEKSDVGGWCADLCVEELGDDEVVRSLARSRCRFVYCGLESLDRAALRGIGKRHNRAQEYLRLIRNAQSRGVEVAVGFILGLDGTRRETFGHILEFCEEAGILYLKLTWLTYNPGTRLHEAMRERGKLLTDDVRRYDGDNPTCLADGLDAEALREGAACLIRRFYNAESAWIRSRHLAGRPHERAQFVLTSECFGRYPLERYRSAPACDEAGAEGSRDPADGLTGSRAPC